VFCSQHFEPACFRADSMLSHLEARADATLLKTVEISPTSNVPHIDLISTPKYLTLLLFHSSIMAAGLIPGLFLESGDNRIDLILEGHIQQPPPTLETCMRDYEVLMWQSHKSVSWFPPIFLEVGFVSVAKK